jgi:hypothetical protein
MIEAALVIVPDVPGLLDPGEDEEVVVHREPEEDREDEDRDPALDDPARRDPQRCGEPAVVEDEDEDAEGGPGREQVQEDRLDRDDDRVEGDEHQQE